MIFALATDDMTLTAFASKDEAISNCEGIDVYNGNWLFFAKSGTPLKAVFSILPKGRILISSGKYTLEDGERPTLNGVLDRVSFVSGCGLRSILDVARILETPVRNS